MQPMMPLPGMRPRGPKPPWVLEQEARTPVGPVFEGAAPEDSISSFDALARDLAGAGVSQLAGPGAAGAQRTPELSAGAAPVGLPGLARPDAAGDWSTYKQSERQSGIYMPNEKGVWETKATFAKPEAALPGLMPGDRERMRAQGYSDEDVAAFVRKKADMEWARKTPGMDISVLDPRARRAQAREDETADLTLEGQRNKVRGVLAGAEREKFDAELAAHKHRQTMDLEKFAWMKQQGASELELQREAQRMSQNNYNSEMELKKKALALQEGDLQRRHGREDTVWGREDQEYGADAPVRAAERSRKISGQALPQEQRAIRAKALSTVQEVAASMRQNYPFLNPAEVQKLALNKINDQLAGAGVAPLENVAFDPVMPTDEDYNRAKRDAEKDVYHGSPNVGKFGRFVSEWSNPIGWSGATERIAKSQIDEPIVDRMVESLMKFSGLPKEQAEAYVRQKYYK